MQNSIIKTFFQLVKIDSESGKEERFAKHLARLLKKYSSKIDIDKHGNLYIYSSGYSSRGALMLNTHMDTVSPGVGIRPKIDHDSIFSSGNTILGADSKAGIAAFVELLKYATKNSLRPFVVTLTKNEEDGIPSAQYIKAVTKYAIVPDRGSPTGEYSTKAPYAQVFQINAKGKFAYAPTNYKDGKSALLSLAALANALALGDIDSDTTANLGTFVSGNSASMIPDSAYLKGSLYSFKKSSVTKYFENLERLASIGDKKFGTSTAIELLEYYPGFESNDDTDFTNTVREAIKTAGKNPILTTYKAVTNANFLHKAGMETILISTGVKKQHTTSESISIKDLEYIYNVIINVVSNK